MENDRFQSMLFEYCVKYISEKPTSIIIAYKERINSWCEQLQSDKRAEIEKMLKDNHSGCYIAACVYGSYDCPQVLTLRKFWDNTLKKTWYGKMFVKCYYAISPTLVDWFGDVLTTEIKTETERCEMTEDAVYTEKKRILFFGLPWTYTKYIITPSMLTIDEGLLKTTENDCYMYKIQDVRLTQTLLEKIFHLGTVECFSGDVTHPDLKLIHIKHAREIKNYIIEASEEARIKRRTVHMMDIGAETEELE